METARVVQVDDYEIRFDNGYVLSSDHDQDCCESHYLSFRDLSLEDFDRMDFDLSGDSFFRKVEDFGIRLIAKDGREVPVPGYGFNNGYYGDNISLVLTNSQLETIGSWDVSECQVARE